MESRCLDKIQGQIYFEKKKIVKFEIGSDEVITDEIKAKIEAMLILKTILATGLPATKLDVRFDAPESEKVAHELKKLIENVNL